jgi:membrane-bound lytic murein transglycosylase A
MRPVHRAAIVAAVLVLSACTREETQEPPAPAEPVAILSEVTFAELPGWTADRTSEAIPAFRRSCERLMSQPDDRPVGPDGLGGTVADWRAPCTAAEELPAGDDTAARRFFETAFTPFAVAASEGPNGLFTGYYEMEIHAARQPDLRFDVPLYRRPDDLVTVALRDFRADLPAEVLVGRVVDGRLRPYPTRAEIDSGALAGRGLELLWLESPVDAFFLHIQGSARVRLAEGGTTRIGYAASNGHAFFGIARTLIDSGAIDRENASMQSVRDWLRAHPEEARKLMHQNARYIFFREIEEEVGPIGAMGAPLTPLRSLAIDPNFLPLGAPIWLDTVWPPGQSDAAGQRAGEPMRRLMVAQDTGGAIKGPVRGDIFWGTGEAALARAGGMKQTGRYFLLLPRAVAERRARTS